MSNLDNNFLLPMLLEVSKPGTVEIVPGRGIKFGTQHVCHAHPAAFRGDAIGARSFTPSGQIYFTKIFSSKLKADLIGDVEIDTTYFNTDKMFQDFAFGEFSAKDPLCFSFRAAEMSTPPIMNLVLVYRELALTQAA